MSDPSLVLSPGQLFRTGKGRPVPLPENPYPLADTHGHLTCFRGLDPALAICRAALAGVGLLVVPVDPTDDAFDPSRLLSSITGWQQGAHELLGMYAEAGIPVPSFPETSHGLSLPAAVRIIAGTHPYGAEIFDGDARARLLRLLDDPRCVGVGEIGLDLTCDVDPAVQERAFREQLAIASDHGLPVELHIRDAADDPTATAHRMCERILDEVGLPAAGCDLHCFTSGPEVLAPFVEMGCHVAFGGAATFKRSQDIREAAVAMPSHLLLSETDCPYMAPVPLRGQECEPAMVAFSASVVADVRAEAGVAERDETLRALWENAVSLFSLAR